MRCLSVDLRSLALFRVALALMLLADLIDRATDLEAHYTDFGLLPRGPLLEKFDNPNHFSLHVINGTWQFQAVLFALAALFALQLLVGWRTRLATALSWVLLISLHARNAMVLQAGDVLLRLLLFWALFLPLGARASVDAALAPPKDGPQNDRHLSVPSLALMLQVAFVYWFGVLLKSGKEWYPDGTAVYYALQLDLLATRAGVWLRQFPALLGPMTHGTLVAEALFPFLLFLPKLRLPGVILLAGMHASFGTFMELGNFPWIDLVAMAPLLPAGVWDTLGRLAGTPARTAIELRGKYARIARSLLLLGRAKVGDTTGDFTLVDDQGKITVGRDAWTEVVRRSPIGGPLAAWTVARIPWPARLWERLTPALDGALRPRPVREDVPGRWQVAAAFAFALVVWWNLTGLTEMPLWFKPAPGKAVHIGMPRPLANLTRAFRLDQYWAMFAPYPLKEDGWYVAEGHLKDGTNVEALEPDRPRPSTFVKPALATALVPNQRWRKYLMNIWQVSNKEHRLWFGKYLCRTWNREFAGDKRLEEFRLYYMKELTPDDPAATPKAEPVELWHHYCFK